MTKPWYPINVRGDPAAEAEYAQLKQKLPESMMAALGSWIQDAIESFPGATVTLQRLEIVLDLPLDWTYSDRSASKSFAVALHADKSRMLLLNAIDYLLKRHRYPSAPEVIRLFEILELGRTVWTVGEVEGRIGIVRRVPEAVQAGADLTIQEGLAATEHLRKAWAALYGLNPDYSLAYKYSVSALEAAAKPVVSPNNHKMTLGTAISVLRADKDKYTFALEPRKSVQDKPVHPIETIADMMAIVWQPQIRHGTSDTDKPIDHTEAEATAALHQALTLVHWFTHGLITKAA